MKRLLKVTIFLALSTFVFGFVNPAFSPKEEQMEGSWLEKNIDDLTYKIFIPSHPQSAAPFIVGMHGCNQNPDDFSASTYLLEKARQQQFFYMSLKKDKRSENDSTCWQWFNSQNLSTDSVRLNQLMSAILREKNELGLNGAKTYLIGLSAGATMSNILSACFLDQFDGVALLSGPVGFVVSDPAKALGHMLLGTQKSTQELAELAWNCHQGSHDTKLKSVIIVSGNEDKVVNPNHILALTRQYKGIYDLVDDGESNQSVTWESKTVDSSPESASYPYTHVQWRSNFAEIHSFLISNLAHAWSGGREEFPYTDPKGPPITDIMLEIWNPSQP